MLETFWRRRRWVTPICWSALGLSLAIFAVRVWKQDGYSDFLVYYQTSQRLLSGLWGQVYRVDDNYNMFRYNPMVLPLFWPWALVSHPLSREVFFFLNLTTSVFGFAFIGKALWGRRLGQREKFILLLSAAMTLRFFLDGLYMGQVVGLIFGSLGVYLWALNRGSALSAGFALWLPSSLKVGFAVLTPLAVFRGFSFFAKVGLTVVAICVAFSMIVLLGAGFNEVATMIHSWNSTLDTVLTPQSVLYWDSKDFRTQAINSALIRMSAWGWFDVTTAFYLWKSIAFTGLALLGVTWLRVWLKMRGRLPKPRLLALLVSLGVMAYLLLMPWSYRHTLALLALPVIVLISDEGPSRSRLWFWALFLINMSLGGSVFAGERLAFWLQEISLPVVIMLWMTWILAYELKRELRRIGA